MYFFGGGGIAARREKAEGVEKGSKLGSRIRIGFPTNESRRDNNVLVLLDDKGVKHGVLITKPGDSQRAFLLMHYEKAKIEAIVQVEWTERVVGPHYISDREFDKLAKKHGDKDRSAIYDQGFRIGLEDGYMSPERLAGSTGKWVLLWITLGIPVLCLIGWYLKKR